jgi:hypothetical protein
MLRPADFVISNFAIATAPSYHVPTLVLQADVA